MKVVANERYQRSDTVGHRPGAEARLGQPGRDADRRRRARRRALPQKTLKERGYKGKIYQTHGVANNDFLRVVRQGRARAPSCRPARCWSPSSCRPTTRCKKVGARLRRPSTRRRYGKGSARPSAATPRTPSVLLQAAIPVALKKAKPGTQGVPRRAARCARRRAGRRRRARRVQHDADRPPRARPARGA
ncbi:MAG: hypothetical protein MZV49_09530 [Rhodopseudomonas palustris]|nr:hypothetical protein [Rhodopseudomonas palustris]